MDRYQAYSEYKISGIDWLGEIPKHWIATRIKHIGMLKGGAGFPHDEQGVTDQELDLHKVNALGKTGSEGFLEKSENTISLETAKKLGAFVFPEKSIVFAKVGAALLLGRIRWLKYPSCLDNNMMGLVVRSIYDSRYIKHAMSTVKFDYVVNPGAIPSLNESQVGSLFLGIPTLLEQTIIANFLDHETAKIDTLIEKQQQLIQLLKEKRQAVISHAVTKGLNPDVPMKDSGVEWLGEVPEHWEVCAIGYVSNGVFTGGTPKNESSYSDIESDLNWFGPSDFRDTRLLSESNKYLTLESHKLGDSKLFFRDSVLVIGIGATLGKVGYCNKEFSCNQQINVIYPNQRVSYKYLAIALSMQEAQMKISSNASTIGIMNQEKTKSILIAVPPREEQEQIVLSVELIESKYAKLIELAGNQVELLQERRTALISAAVTGKIDVRNFSAQLT